VLAGQPSTGILRKIMGNSLRGTIGERLDMLKPGHVNMLSPKNFEKSK